MHPIAPGVPTVLTPLIRRITAPNPGMMTGPGTNTYLIGNGELALIDPGPDSDTHINAILACIQGMHATLRWILCTHTHLDHSPAAEKLRAATGALVVGMQPSYPERQDPTFRPDQHWSDGDYVATDEFRLEAIHTPGHASNHLCFYLPQEKTLFTGDHIMEGSTVVIAPPDGNMAAYINALHGLKKTQIDTLAPAHGVMMNHAQDVIEGLIQHRLMRETKVIEQLHHNDPIELSLLLTKVYDDVPEFLHLIARYSLLAHLEKLEADQKAIRTESGWVRR